MSGGLCSYLPWTMIHALYITYTVHLIEDMGKCPKLQNCMLQLALESVQCMGMGMRQVVHLLLVVQLGSPIAFADSSTERQLREVSDTGTHGLYIPSGALWGGEDIRRMADRGTLKVTHLRQMDSSYSSTCNDYERV